MAPEGDSTLGVIANPRRFELLAVCDLDPARRAALAAELGVVRTYADADRILAAEQPDVLVFATPPAVREALVELGLRHGVKAIACEKPLACSLGEARRIVDRCTAADVRGVVCHQLRYGAHWQRDIRLQDNGYRRYLLANGSRPGSVAYIVKNLVGRLFYGLLKCTGIDKNRLREWLRHPVDQTKWADRCAQIQCIVRKVSTTA